MATARKVCKIHPMVLFSIVDSYERRNEDAKRVIGTLLGAIDATGVVEVTNCFTVPHVESEDEVAVDIDFAKTMYELHRRVNPVETIVGWYSTGPDVTEHSVLIHEYYAREAKNPVHITVDISLKASRMSTKAYINAPMGVPGKSMGCMFTPVPLEITCYEAERVALDLMQQGKHNPKRTINLTGDLQHIGNACGKLQDMLGIIIQYVDEVLGGRIPADPAMGRFLTTLVKSVPKMNPEEFETMLNANMKDLLMVVYLSNLTRTQLIISEKLGTL